MAAGPTFFVVASARAWMGSVLLRFRKIAPWVVNSDRLARPAIRV